MRLILMRHAKSDWSLNGDDFDRPLNGRGRVSAQALGDWLRTQGYLPDQVLCSSSARTRETLALLGLYDIPARFEDRLYHAAPDTLMRALKEATGDTVLMIAHNPGLAMFSSKLVQVHPLHVRFRDYPTGATLVVDFDIPAWQDLDPRTGDARDFVIPRELMQV